MIPARDVGRSEYFLAPSLKLEGTRSVRTDDPNQSLRRAGWSTQRRLTTKQLDFESLRWSNLRTLLASRDEKLAKHMSADPAGAMRNAWLRELQPDGLAPGPLTVQVNDDGPRRVMLIADTGDGSEAQAAVAEHLSGRAIRKGAQLKSTGVAALLIASDVVYPAGSASEYDRTFRRVYEELFSLGIPIYAIPGNHDWNDGSLSGFMAAFCGATRYPPEITAARREATGGGLRFLLSGWPLWHDSSGSKLPNPSSPPGKPPQNAPYLALDIDGVIFIGIEPGYGAYIDPEQAEWLVRVVESHADAPKLLFTSKPLIVNGHRAPCPFARSHNTPETVVGPETGVLYSSVDDVVRRPENGFVAAIGGDIHNYQRYLAHITANGSRRGWVLPYVVCGGGGVFIGQTGWLDRIDLDESTPDGSVRCDELETVLFPPRAHSRLYLDAVIRQGARRARLTLPIGLALAAAIGLLLWFASLVSMALGYRMIPLPSALVHAGLLVTALAVNISARPISWRGRAVALLVALGGAWLSATYIRHDLSLHSYTLSEREAGYVVAGGLVLGHLFLQIGDSAPLSATRFSRWLGTLVSAIAGLAITGAGALALLASAPESRISRWVVLAVALSAVACTALPWLIVGRVSVAEAFTEAKGVLAGSPPGGIRRVRLAIGNLLARNQRFFSAFETFTSGRLTQKASLKGWPVRVYMPLYRSLLEIEFKRVPEAASEAWDFAFTAYGVTGENTRDTGDTTTAPVIVDAFSVRKSPQGLAVTPIAADWQPANR